MPQPRQTGRSILGGAAPAAAGTAAALFLFALGSLLTAAPVRAQGLPPVPVPPENPITPQKAVLGKMLFWEEQLSTDNTMACGTCHSFAKGGGDARAARHPGFDQRWNTADDVFGSPGVLRQDANRRYAPSTLFGHDVQVTGRATASIFTAPWALELFWDGRASFTFVEPQGQRQSIAFGGALESQAVGPVLDATEMAHAGRDWNAVTQKLAAVQPMALATALPNDVQAALAANSDYPSLFKAAFGDATITAERIAFALATYQRTLVPDQTPFDRNALTPAQQAGLQLFGGKAGCSAVECHELPFFTDFDYRNTGVRPWQEDPGRMKVTQISADRGRFKTPPLRNVGLKARFFHTGALTTLDQVIEFYDRGGDFHDNKDIRVRPLGLTKAERDRIVDFIQNGLTDPRTAQGLPPFDRPTLWSERVPPGSNLYGGESPGSGGLHPRMVAATPANLRSQDFKLGLARGNGGAFALLALSARPAQATVLGIPINVDLGTLVTVAPPGGLAGVGAGNGHATVLLPVPGVPALRGQTLWAQWFVADAAASGGVAATRGAQVPLF